MKLHFEYIFFSAYYNALRYCFKAALKKFMFQDISSNKLWKVKVMRKTIMYNVIIITF